MYKLVLSGFCQFVAVGSCIKIGVVAIISDGDMTKT